MAFTIGFWASEIVFLGRLKLWLLGVSWIVWTMRTASMICPPYIMRICCQTTTTSNHGVDRWKRSSIHSAAACRDFPNHPWSSSLLLGKKMTYKPKSSPSLLTQATTPSQPLPCKSRRSLSFKQQPNIKLLTHSLQPSQSIRSYSQI